MASRKTTSTTRRRKTKKSTKSGKWANVHYVAGKNGGLGHWEYNANSGYPAGTRAPPPRGRRRKTGSSKRKTGVSKHSNSTNSHYEIKQTKKGNKKCYKFCI